MTDQTRDVELVIRAKNLTKTTLQDVRKEIEDVNKALDDQVEASKRGEGSLKDLTKGYGKLEDAMKALLGQQAVIKNFEAQSARLKDLQDKLGAASTRLKEHQAAMEGSEKVTKRQTQQLASYQKAVERADAAVASQATRLAATRKEGESLGLAMNDLVGSQDRLLAAGRRLAEVNDKQSAAYKNLQSNIDGAKRAQKEMADTAAFQKAADEAARLNKAAQYVQFWTQQLDQMEAAQRRADTSANLSRMADGALAAARGYTTLANSTKSFVKNNQDVSRSLRDILDPSQQAMTNLNGIEEQIRQVNAAALAADGPMTSYRQQVKQLADANKALSGTASGIDTFRQQVTALRAARAEFVLNRAALRDYAASVRTADQPTAEMVAELKRLEGALATSATAYQTQAAAARSTQANLRAAGVATNDLATAQARLVTSARNSVTALQNLDTAATRFGTASREASAGLNLFESNGRTALSFMQRLRGEVLALAAGYAGLQGAVTLANDSLTASNTKRGVMNQLALSVGDDPKAIAAEYEYIRKQADRIGVSFQEAAKGYAKFSAAASLAGRSRDEIHYVSEAFQEVGVVANLTAADMDGVFKALEQIYSKGKIQAEELRGQLGDRLFGAFEIAAKALKSQFPDLDKAMKNGLITSEQLLAIAEEYRKTVANRLPTAMESLTANQNRLNSAFFDFKVLIADSGFATEYEKLVLKITSFLKSDDGAQLAKTLSAAFGTIVQGLTYMIDHLDEVQLALELAFGIKAMSLVAGLATSIMTKAIPALIALQTELATTGVAGVSAASGISAAFVALAATFAGLKIGEYLYEKFDAAKFAGISLAETLMGLFTQLSFAVQAFGVSISTGFEANFTKMMNAAKDAVDGTLNFMAKGADAIGADEIAGKIRNGLTDGTRVGVKDASEELDKLKKKLNDTMELNKNMFDLQRRMVGKDRPVYGAPDAVGATPKPVIPPKPAAFDQAGYEREVKKRISLADQLTKELESAEAKIQKNEKDSLDSRMQAIDTAYQKVFRQIDALAKLPGGADQANQMRETLNGYIGLLKAQETEKFNAEQKKKDLAEVAESERRINELIALRTQLLQNVQVQQQQGNLTDLEAKQQIAAIDANYVPQINAATDATLKLAEANKAAFDPLAFQNMVAKLQAIPPSLKTVKNELISAQQVNEKISGGIAGGFEAFADAAAKGENAVQAMGQAFTTFALDFAKQIVQMILKQMILNALQASFGGGGGAIAGAINGLVAHGGGVVGQSTGRSKNVSPGWFAGAPKYHTGGVVGLAPDEYPAILQKNEEVLAKNDPRNILNSDRAAAAGGAPSQQPINLKMVNAIDSTSVLQDALSTVAGEQTFLNVIKANRAAVRNILG